MIATPEHLQRTHIGWLDYGRTIASISVMMSHYFYSGYAQGMIEEGVPGTFLSILSRNGDLGVQFFFAISGFVILLSIEGKTALQFAASRFVRIYPTYFACLCITSIALLLMPLGFVDLSWRVWFANLTLNPHVFGFHYIDGVYWTLTAELYFYTFVFAVMIIGLQRYLKPIMIMWFLLQVAAIALDKERIFLAGPTSTLPLAHSSTSQ